MAHDYIMKAPHQPGSDGSCLVLVDALGIVYRSFFAIRGMSRSDGTPTNALYGFVRTLNQVRAHLRPTHWAVAFDGGLPAERTESIPEYKAQRPHMPDDMRVQLPLIADYLAAAGIPSILRDGVEADDVIASLVARYAGMVERIVVLSSDKDLFQLVTDTVTIAKSGTGADAMGPDEVIAKTGVRPDQIAAWLALVGDSADNIGGVPGIGGKTAARLLATYGTIDGIWAHLDELGAGKVAASLGAARDLVARNLGVVRLNTALPDLPELAALVAKAERPACMLPFYEAMEFQSLAAALRSPELPL